MLRIFRPESLVGFFLALFLLCGRWSLARFLEVPSAFLPFVEIRLWAVIMLLLLIPVFCFTSKSHQNTRYHLSTLPSIFVIFFIFYMIITLFWAPHLYMALWKAYELSLIILTIFLLQMFLKVADWGELIQSLWTSIFLISGALALLGILYVFMGSIGRLSVLGGGPNIFGRIMGFLMLAGLYFWSRKHLFWITLPTTIVAGLLILLSGSRGALVASILATLTFFLFERIGLKRIFSMMILITIILFSIFSFSSLANIVKEMIQSRIVDLMFEEVYTSGRVYLYSEALDMGMKNPISGSGLAAFPVKHDSAYPHNISLEIFAEGGCVGFLLFLIALLVFLKSLWKNRNLVYGANVGGFVLMFIASQFSGDFYDSRGVFIFMLLAFLPKTTSDQQTGMQEHEVFPCMLYVPDKKLR